VTAAAVALWASLLTGAAAQPPQEPSQTPAPAPTPAEPQPADVPQQQPELPVFRAGVDVVSLNVTVTDKGGRYLQGLTEGQFSVFEDGVKQDLIYFSGTQLPTALALLIDTSASMNDRMATAQQAAVGFVERMTADDMATVIDFDSRAEILQTFTDDQAQLQAAIRRTTAGGSTSLYNAIYIALNEFKRMRAASQDEVRRQAIVVLSDGEDTSSLVAFDEVLELAKRTEVSIYAIGLLDQNGNTSRRGLGGFREAEFVLKQFAQETGGRAFFPSSANELAGIYGQVADELAAQYTLGYAPKNARRDGRWRRVVVRVERPDALARTKQGYYAPTGNP
jgi:Ca-activated chloride channel family protein